MDAETLEAIERHSGIIAEDVRSDVRGVAEAVASHREEFRQEIRGVRSELDELEAMIKLSYTEIDRRFRALESDVSSLRARVEKLEDKRVS